jgi:SAM-dependent methyltransferase
MGVGTFPSVRSYRAVGDEFFGYFKELCALKPHEAVLDVGCGCGQMAVPLTDYLHQSAHYEGFDIVNPMIAWCKRSISSKYPNFNFQLVDILNKNYNPNGRCSASEYTFPYDTGSFDFALVKSVFTHMLHRDVTRYLSEIARVLKKSGRCMITYFLVNEESRRLMDANASTLDFPYILSECHVASRRVPEAAVAYDEEYVRSLHKTAGLTIVEPIRYGSWSGRSNFLSYQDIVLSSKS